MGRSEEFKIQYKYKNYIFKLKLQYIPLYVGVRVGRYCYTFKTPSGVSNLNPVMKIIKLLVQLMFTVWRNVLLNLKIIKSVQEIRAMSNRTYNKNAEVIICDSPCVFCLVSHSIFFKFFHTG